ncbi:hypothetical protein Tco_0501573, partial [Tanacetum coccineum]
MSGATWRNHCSDTVTGDTAGPPVKGGGPPPEHRQTTGQRWPVMVNGVGPPSEHRWTTAGSPVNHRSMVVDRQSAGGS